MIDSIYPICLGKLIQGHISKQQQHSKHKTGGSLGPGSFPEPVYLMWYNIFGHLFLPWPY